jgi:hypothetical protein
MALSPSGPDAGDTIAHRIYGAYSLGGGRAGSKWWVSRIRLRSLVFFGAKYHLYDVLQVTTTELVACACVGIIPTWADCIISGLSFVG